MASNYTCHMDWFLGESLVVIGFVTVYNRCFAMGIATMDSASTLLVAVNHNNIAS